MTITAPTRTAPTPTASATTAPSARGDAHVERSQDRSRTERSSIRRTMTGALRDERGAETAEYAIATMAAVAFAGLLVAIMQSDAVRGMLEDLVERALTFVG